MKNLKILAVPFIAMFLMACEGDPLSLKQTNYWDDEAIWRLREAAEGPLIKAYHALDNLPDHYDENFLDAATDNVVSNDHTSSAWKAGNGMISRTNPQIGIWSSAYTQFQYIHEFMDNGFNDIVTYLPKPVDESGWEEWEERETEIRKRYYGEAHFLRAYWAFKLLQRHGGCSDSGVALGYPIVTKFINPDEADADWLFTRNTYEECVRQIISDCDTAIKYLPETYSAASGLYDGSDQIGRASSIAAWILKSNVALYGVSPAFQDNDVVRINGMGDYTVLDAQTVQEKWERAAYIADSVFKEVGNFGTFYAIKSSDLVGVTAATPNEHAFRRWTNNHNMENRHNPPYNYGKAKTVPSHNLAMAFPARNGYPLDDPRSDYDKNDPYGTARDNRFELIYYYQGKTYNNALGAIDVVYGGKDSPAFSPYATSTGYYLAKFISNGTVDPTNIGSNTRYYPYIRRAEAFLNYAEAANEAWGPYGTGNGCLYSAYEVIKTVRAQSGGITDTGYLDEVAAQGEEAFRALIQNERRLEFAFENQRFFDMRRWLLPLDETVTGVEVTRNADGSLNYEEIEVERRPMNDPKYYFIPLPESELLKNDKLVNNMGWN